MISSVFSGAMPCDLCKRGRLLQANATLLVQDPLSPKGRGGFKREGPILN